SVCVVVRLSDRPIESHLDEADLIQGWMRDVIVAVGSKIAGTSAETLLHAYLWDHAQHLRLVSLLNRQSQAILGLEPVMELFTQVAGFEGAHISIVSDEVERQRRLPLLWRSLQSVAPWFGFKWSPELRQTFHYRHFDGLGRPEDAAEAARPEPV